LNHGFEGFVDRLSLRVRYGFEARLAVPPEPWPWRITSVRSQVRSWPPCRSA